MPSIYNIPDTGVNLKYIASKFFYFDCHSGLDRESRVPGENRDPAFQMVPAGVFPVLDTGSGRPLDAGSSPA